MARALLIASYFKVCPIFTDSAVGVGADITTQSGLTEVYGRRSLSRKIEISMRMREKGMQSAHA